jgi:glucose-1-phosphate thymidylyltransferase
MIGIVLAGGSGTRLFPLTRATSKQLLPVYDKPMIYYPIGTLMLAGIREIILITTLQDQSNFKNLLGDGKRFGVNFRYLTQEQPKGLAQAFSIAEKYILGKKTALILGDNIFHGTSLGTELKKYQNVVGADIFGYHVSNPNSYGVVVLDEDKSPIDIIEKPKDFRSSIAIPGLYFYDETVIEKAKEVKPSERGELEITSVNKMYLSEGSLRVNLLHRGTTWLDTGTFDTLFEATSYVKVIQERQGYQISCLEEIAYRNNWITTDELEMAIRDSTNLVNSNYLKTVLHEN